MSKKASIILVIIFAVPLQLSLFAQSGDSERTITILHSENLQQRAFSGGQEVEDSLAEVSALAEYMRFEGETLLLDAGQSSGDRPLASVNTEELTALRETIETIGYDAIVPGVRDFAYGVEPLREFRELTDIPILSANTSGSSGEQLLSEYEIVEKDGLTIGVFGLSDPRAQDAETGEEIEIDDPLEAAEEAVSAIEAEGADLVVAVAPLGLADLYEEDYFSDEELAAARETFSGRVDLIIDGNSDYSYDEPLRLGETVITAADADENLGGMELSLADGELVAAEALAIDEVIAEAEQFREEGPPVDTLTIVHTDNLHDRALGGQTDELTGLLDISAVVRSARNRGETVVLDAGQFDGEAVMREYDEAGRSALAEAVDTIGYDALVPAAGDFYGGIEPLRKFAHAADAVPLSANLEKDNEPLFRPYEVFEREHANVGVFGLTEEGIRDIVAYVSGFDRAAQLTLGDPVEAAKSAVESLEDSGADIVVAVVPFGLADMYAEGVFSEEYIERAKEMLSGRVDVIIDGNSEHSYDEPLHLGDTIITGTGGVESVGTVAFDFEKDSLIGTEVQHYDSRRIAAEELEYEESIASLADDLAESPDQGEGDVAAEDEREVELREVRGRPAVDIFVSGVATLYEELYGVSMTAGFMTPLARAGQSFASDVYLGAEFEYHEAKEDTFEVNSAGIDMTVAYRLPIENLVGEESIFSELRIMPKVSNGVTQHSRLRQDRIIYEGTVYHLKPGLLLDMPVFSNVRLGVRGGYNMYFADEVMTNIEAAVQIGWSL